MKIIFQLILLIAINVSTAFSQEITWQKTIGSSLDDNIVYIEQTADGGYIMGGISQADASGDKSQNTNGVEDYWVVKTDSLGNIQWDKTLGGSGIDKLSKIIQTYDGGYLVGGTSSSDSSGNKSEHGLGFDDFWIVKLDSVGNVIWDNTIGGAWTDQLNDFIQTTDGGFVLAGNSGSPISIDKSEASWGGLDYWIVKTDANGIIQWDNTIGGTSTDELKSISATADGGYILGGNSTSTISGDKSEDTLGRADFWIVKVDSLGVIQWQNTIGANSYDFFSSIEQTADGGYIAGGETTSSVSGDLTKGSYSGADLWILKLDAVGNIQWQNTIGAGGADFCELVRQTNDGGYLIGSWRGGSIDGDRTVISKGSNDYWLIKLNDAGQIQWQRSIGGSGSEVFRSFDITSDGQYILGGYSKSDISGDKTENSKGLFDYWIVKFRDDYNLIFGKSFIDLNGNGVQEINEPGLANIRHHELNTGNLTLSGTDGSYVINVLDTGNFIVFPDSIPYYSVVPAQQNAYFTGTNQQDSLNNFAFQSILSVNDLQIKATATNIFRPGFKGNYLINCKNVGTTTLSSTAVVFLDSGLTFDGSSILPDYIGTDSLVWNIDTLAPFAEKNILLTVNISASIGIGTTANSDFKIYPIAGDSTPDDNQIRNSITVRGSFDPNDISVNRTTVFTNELPSAPYLEYFVRFQNTGTDTAFNVKVINPISLNADISSFEFIEASHPVSVNYIKFENTMEFVFDNILLPDSNTDEVMSHGFLKYRIKPLSNLVDGNSISNAAYIYFDYNYAVPTNIVYTYITLPTYVSEISQGAEIGLYPNPARDEINIILKLKTSETVSFAVYNLLGEKLIVTESQKFLAGENIFSIKLSDLSPGIYIVQANLNGKSFSKRIVKM